MKRWTGTAVVVLLLALSLAAGASPARPKIFGVASVAFYVSRMRASYDFYASVLNTGTGPLTHDATGASLPVNESQRVQLTTIDETVPENFLRDVFLAVSDVRAMRRYLESRGVPPVYAADKNKGPFTVVDPEGHRISFVEWPETLFKNFGPDSQSQQIIHAGFIVRDRAATEHFYKHILGFRPYWHGGMKDDQTDWVSMQVPDGTDWLEFMVNVDANPDQRLRGIMNHIAIGVTDIHETEKRLRAAGAPVTEPPEIGRDGKWQLNLYDPDLTRIEFMEFKPVQKPCCSEFTGPHPNP